MLNNAWQMQSLSHANRNPGASDAGDSRAQEAATRVCWSRGPDTGPSPVTQGRWTSKSLGPPHVGRRVCFSEDNEASTRVGAAASSDRGLAAARAADAEGCGIERVCGFRESQLTLFCKLPTTLGIIQGMAGFRNHFSRPPLILREGVTGMRMSPIISPLGRGEPLRHRVDPAHGPACRAPSRGRGGGPPGAEQEPPGAEQRRGEQEAPDLVGNRSSAIQPQGVGRKAPISPEDSIAHP